MIIVKRKHFFQSCTVFQCVKKKKKTVSGQTLEVCELTLANEVVPNQVFFLTQGGCYTASHGICRYLPQT